MNKIMERRKDVFRSGKEKLQRKEPHQIFGDEGEVESIFME